MGLIFHTEESLKVLKDSETLKAKPFDPIIAAITAQNINSTTTKYINSDGQIVNLQPLKCETFEREDLRVLLEDTEVSHLRIYLGIQEKGTITERKDVLDLNRKLEETHYCLIIVPILNGEEIIDKAVNIREYGYPCPPICDPLDESDLENDPNIKKIAPRKLNPR